MECCFRQKNCPAIAQALSSEEKSSSSPGFVINVGGQIEHKILILNGRCGTAQGAYNIIIIDREINLADAHSNGGSQPSLVIDKGDKLGHLASNTEFFSLQDFSVFPNPATSSSEANLKFHLEKYQAVSIDILEISTGRLMKRILSNEIYSKGRHQVRFAASSLNTGAYLIILRTAQEQRSLQWINP